MYGYRGRGGPSKSTPANVQCQKCLKRDKHTHATRRYKRHYSYECKASSQERPYVSRPSRSQQFRNPKLAPKLTNDTLDPLEKKKGAADEELAKKEAERAKQDAGFDGHDDEDEPRRRERSVSSASVSTISTDSRGASPPARRRSRSPVANQRDSHVRASRSPRRRYSSSRSRSPVRRENQDKGDIDRRKEDSSRSGRRRDNGRPRSLSPFSKRLAMSREG